MSQLVLPVLSRWSRRVFWVELNGAPVYFSLEERPGRAAPGLFSGLRPGEERCFSLLVGAPQPLLGARLHAQLRDTLRRELPARCTVSPMSCFLPGVRDSLLRGFFLQDGSDCPSRTRKLVRDLAEQEELLVCSYRPHRDPHPDRDRDRGERCTQHVWTPRGGGRAGADPGGGLCVVPSEAPRVHPAALSIINSHVFYKFQDARDVLTSCVSFLPEASQVLQLLPGEAPPPSQPDLPVVVVEGLDATGKSTLTESLRDALGAALLHSPPRCLAPWRAAFDRQPPIVRRAFYAVGNYVTAGQILQQALETPVIVDRFWHSTAAYAVAEAVSGPVSSLPDQGSEVYRWPADLLRPSLVVLLTLDPEERRRRLGVRGQGRTEEEQQLDDNQLFRLRVEEAYRRISSPACIAVDASPPADQVLQQVLHLIRDKCCL